jgi:hypothetical protein
MSMHYVLRANGPTSISIERIMQSEMAVTVAIEEAGLLLSFHSGEIVRVFYDGIDYWSERLTEKELREFALLAASIGAVIEDDLGQRYAIRSDGSVAPQEIRASAPRPFLSGVVSSTHPVSLVVLAIGVISLIYAVLRRLM